MSYALLCSCRGRGEQDGAGRGRGRPAPRPQARPRRSAAAAASTGTVTGCGAPATAQSGSFSPFPVTVQTIVWPGSTLPCSAALQQARDGRGGRGLDEDALLRGQQPVGAQDLTVRHLVDEAAGLVAGRQGVVPGGRVADADGGGDGGRVPDDLAAHQGRGAGGLEAPHARGAGGGAVGRVLAVALPVRGDVARVADRQDVDVGGVAEHVHDLERGGLLALDPHRVDGIDQRHG